MNFFTGYELSLPWQMIAYLSTGLAAGLIAGYCTKPLPKDQLDKFYNDLNTPVDGVEKLASDTM